MVPVHYVKARETLICWRNELPLNEDDEVGVLDLTVLRNEQAEQEEDVAQVVLQRRSTIEAEWGKPRSCCGSAAVLPVALLRSEEDRGISGLLCLMECLG